MYTSREISNKRSGRLQIQIKVLTAYHFYIFHSGIQEPLLVWSFPEMEKEFIEISDSEKSLKHELESI